MGVAQPANPWGGGTSCSAAKNHTTRNNAAAVAARTGPTLVIGITEEVLGEAGQKEPNVNARDDASLTGAICSAQDETQRQMGLAHTPVSGH